MTLLPMPCRPTENNDGFEIARTRVFPSVQPSSPSSTMALSNVGSLVLHLLIFITTLVNFSYALTSLEPLMLLALYAISKIFVTAPEEGIFAKCQHRNLYEPYQDG
jgi:hypothetical protein